MNKLYKFITVIIGASGVVAQAVFVRELLVSFLGNELTIGIILASWLIAEALGVLLIGMIIGKSRYKQAIFVGLFGLFTFILPLSVYLMRIYKSMAGIGQGEAAGLTLIIAGSFLLQFCIAFIHGGLFSATCSILPFTSAQKPYPTISFVYTWETIGSVLGGVIVSFLLLTYFSTFLIIYSISLLNLVGMAVLIRQFFPRSSFKYLGLLAGVSVLAVWIWPAAKLERLSCQKQYPYGSVLACRNSAYGNLVVSRRNAQDTFFYNGLPFLTQPDPDTVYVEEFSHIPMLFVDDPQDILILHSGLGGLIAELLKYPVNKIDYVELDPAVIEMVRRLPSAVTMQELMDKRLRIFNTDARVFLKQDPALYDVIFVGIKDPSDLISNRFFTKEFFALAKSRCSKEGVLVLSLPGSLTYLSASRKDLNATVLNSLKLEFPHVLVIPGDYYNIFLASKFGGHIKSNVSPGILYQKLLQSGVKTTIYTKDYLDYRLAHQWQVWFDRALSGSTQQANTDYQPLAVFESLVFWNEQFSPFTARVMGLALRHKKWVGIAAICLLLACLIFLLREHKCRADRIIKYAIATSGFWAMSMTVMLFVLFQIYYGSLYQQLGALTALFMCGLATGSIVAIKCVLTKSCNIAWLIHLEFLMIISSLLVWMLMQYSWIMFLVSGFLVGFEFSYLSSLAQQDNKQVGLLAGGFYFADLLGSCLAALLIGIIGLPLFGFLGTIIFICICKATSLIALGAQK